MSNYKRPALCKCVSSSLSQPLSNLHNLHTGFPKYPTSLASLSFGLKIQDPANLNIWLRTYEVQVLLSKLQTRVAASQAQHVPAGLKNPLVL